MTHRPYTPPAWQSKPLADGRVTLLVLPLKVQPKYEYRSWEANLPYAPGDLIWCRETWRQSPKYKNRVGYKSDGAFGCWSWDGDGNSVFIPQGTFLGYPPGGGYGLTHVGDSWRSPVTMPKWAARTWLRCTGVEVRRVQTITAYEAERVGGVLSPQAEWGGLTHRFTFEVKWNRQHGPKPAVDLSFDANPWATFVTVEKISKEDV